jgi:hypothetical protein
MVDDAPESNGPNADHPLAHHIGGEQQRSEDDDEHRGDVKSRAPKIDVALRQA